ncbi:MAG: GAF domain-containing protein [Bacteroidota bacterium]
METITVVAEEKSEKYDELFPQIVALVRDEKDLIANLANISAALKSTFSPFSWVGFYRMGQSELILGPFQGKVACVRIKIGKGVCGTAAKERKTVLVPDVTKFPGHIACDPESKSEIVVPIIYEGILHGVMDIDSEKIDCFDEIDKINLEKIAAIVAPKFN